MEEYSENEIRIKRSIFWKIYFVLLICLIVWGTNESLIDENSGLVEIIDVPMTLIATIGLFGYVFSKRIYKQWFWICFFGVYSSYSFFSFFKANEVNLYPLFTVIFAITLTLPAYIALLLYALPSNKLWKKIER